VGFVKQIIKDSKDFGGVTIAIHLCYFAYLGSDMIVPDSPWGV
jgi:hypothetical protein